MAWATMAACICADISSMAPHHTGGRQGPNGWTGLAGIRRTLSEPVAGARE